MGRGRMVLLDSGWSIYNERNGNLEQKSLVDFCSLFCSFSFHLSLCYLSVK
jgi:hypothetical protein